MLKAGLLGLFAGSSLLIGAFLGIYLKIPRRVIAVIMAFGAGVLICTLAFDLMEEAFKKGGFDSALTGFVAGALLFVFGDLIVNRRGGHHRKETLTKIHHAMLGRRAKAREEDGEEVLVPDEVTPGPALLPEKTEPPGDENSGMAIFIGALLDGIPETAAIGIGLRSGKGFGVLMAIAVFISNLPEGISGANSMSKSGKSKKFIISLWLGVTVACVLSSLFGFLLLSRGGPDLDALALSFAAGAILAMVSSTMIPEAFDDEGRLTPIATPLATVAGFFVAFVLSRLTT